MINEPQNPLSRLSNSFSCTEYYIKKKKKLEKSHFFISRFKRFRQFYKQIKKEDPFGLFVLRRVLNLIFYPSCSNSANNILTYVHKGEIELFVLKPFD